MIKNEKRDFILGGILGVLFVLFTVLILTFDVQPIGPDGTEVGFAALNRSFFALTGVHMFLYTLTDWLGLLPIAVAFGFFVFGLYQWIRRRSLRKVDADILILGGFYLIVMLCYIFFEMVVVNYRPILMPGASGPEASYPSSHTMVALFILLTAVFLFRQKIGNRTVRITAQGLSLLCMAVIVVGRLLAGVHWLTDVVAGALLSLSLFFLYRAFASLILKHAAKNNL